MALLCRWILRFGSLAAFVMAGFGCSDNAGNTAAEASINRQDLVKADLKIVSGQPAEAVAILEKLNRDFPENTEVLELLGLARSETGDYLEAAFWYEQAADKQPNGASFLKRAGECYELAGEDESATFSYNAYVAREPSDGLAWHKLYQLHARAARAPGLPKDELRLLAKQAINAINKAKVAITPGEALEIARLLLKINILPVAESYFEEVSNNPKGDQRAALLGLLEVHLAQTAGDKAESTARLLHQRFPGVMDGSPLAPAVIQLLAIRHAATFFALDYGVEGHSVNDLFATLQEAEDAATVIPSPGKLAPGDPADVGPETEIPEPEPPISLAELFGLNDSQTSNTSPDANSSSAIDKTTDFLERAQLALLDENPRGAQLFLKEAIKTDPENGTAWYLRSRAHWMAAESVAAEMTATEAVRLDGDSLEIRLHYIETARSTLTPRLFLIELDKAHEKFPRSLDILWQLARQYHEIEEKPAIAAILYRRFIGMAPAGHPMLARVRRELTLLGNP